MERCNENARRGSAEDNRIQGDSVGTLPAEPSWVGSVHNAGGPPLPCLGPILPKLKQGGQGAPTGGMHGFNGVSLSQMLKRLEKNLKRTIGRSECFA